MNDEQYFLANAYLDGELTDGERALAEADPTVMAGVEELRALQAGLRDVDAPSATARDAAVAAAMAEFRIVAAPAPGRVVPFRRRPASGRWLGVAAAAVGIGLVGVVIANGVNTGQDEAADPAVADDAAEEPAEEARSAVAEQAAEEPAEEPAAEAMDAEVSPLADEPAAELADEPASAPAEEPALEDAGGAAGRPVIDPELPVATPAELGSFGTYLLELLEAGELPPTPNTACEFDAAPGILGETEYVFDGVPTPILVEVDAEARRVVAIDPDSCAPLVVGPLFR